MLNHNLYIRFFCLFRFTYPEEGFLSVFLQQFDGNAWKENLLNRLFLSSDSLGFQFFEHKGMLFDCMPFRPKEVEYFHDGVCFSLDVLDVPSWFTRYSGMSRKVIEKYVIESLAENEDKGKSLSNAKEMLELGLFESN